MATREETGLSAGRLERLATATSRTRSATRSPPSIRATELARPQRPPRGPERLHARPDEWAEAWPMLRRGEITDSMSVIALLHEAARRAGVLDPRP